jgi:hypothetical protein
MNYYNDFDNCHTVVIDSIKSMLYARHHDIFERLDFFDDSIYLEPLLFTYLTQQDDKWLDSIIYGYEKNKKEEILVFTNNDGVIYIPQVGYFKTERRQHCKVVLRNTKNGLKLKHEGNDLPYTFEPLLYLSYNIELLKYQHPLLETFFHSSCEISDDFQMKDVYQAHVDNINKALLLLEKSNAEHFELLKKVLKRVVCFTSTSPNSFATLEVHHMIFFNVNKWNNELFFVDHLSHEGAHITFYTLTYKSKSRLFKYHHNTPFSEVIEKSDDRVSLYLRFHGLFTFIEILKSLKNCFNDSTLSIETIHEVKGRFAFQLERFGFSLEPFEKKQEILTDEGKNWFNFFKEEYLKLYEEHGCLIDEYDLLMPAYDFNSETFLQKNPLKVIR